MGEAEGFFGEEGDADARKKKRRRTEQNMEQPLIQSKPRPARLRRQQDIRTAQESRQQQRFGEVLAQQVADVIANARDDVIACTELADLANIESSL